MAGLTLLALQCSSYKPLEKRVWRGWPALELRVELAGYEKWMSRQLHDLHQTMFIIHG